LSGNLPKTLLATYFQDNLKWDKAVKHSCTNAPTCIKVNPEGVGWGAGKGWGFERVSVSRAFDRFVGPKGRGI
jgi:hypothetical protein